MTRTLTQSLLVAALLAGSALPSLAQQTRPEPAHAAREGQPGLRLAAHLAALETLVGITAEQAPAWRTYTNALLAFAETARPPHGPQAPGAKAERPAPPSGPHPADAPRLLMAEMMAERALDQAEAAATLKQAAATLRAALGAEQLVRLIAAERPPMPHPGAGPRPPRPGN